MELLWIAKCCTTKMMVKTCHVCWNPSDIMGCLPPIKYLNCCRISRCARLPDCPVHPRQVVKRGLVWTEYLGNVVIFTKDGLDGLVWKASVYHSSPLKHLEPGFLPQIMFKLPVSSSYDHEIPMVDMLNVVSLTVASIMLKSPGNLSESFASPGA